MFSVEFVVRGFVIGFRAFRQLKMLLFFQLFLQAVSKVFVMLFFFFSRFSRAAWKIRDGRINCLCSAAV